MVASIGGLGHVRGPMVTSLIEFLRQEIDAFVHLVEIGIVLELAVLVGKIAEFVISPELEFLFLESHWLGGVDVLGEVIHARFQQREDGRAGRLIGSGNL